jgi:hypothetical protein
MKRVSAVAMIALVALLLAACGSAYKSGTAAGGASPHRFKSAGAWIQALNQDGVTCKPAQHPGIDGPEIARSQPAVCQLSNGDRLTVLIVDNAAQAYHNQFQLQQSARVLYGANWLVIAPNTTPAQTIQTIRHSFHAHG